MYIYCRNWLRVISCQEQISRLLVEIHRKNIHQLASLRFLNLEKQNIKMRRKTYEDLLFFSFMRLCSKSPARNRIPQLFLYLQSFLIAAAIIIATHGQKTLHWQLRKVILLSVIILSKYNCNFEAVNYVLYKGMKKLEMEHEPFTGIIIFYLALCIRFRKEFLMLSLS